MTNKELTNLIDEKFINRVMGYAYNRTQNSYDAQELCSDIIYEIIRSFRKGAGIKNFDSYVWTLAGNVYADFCAKRKKSHDLLIYTEDINLLDHVKEETDDADDENLKWIIDRIAFLSKAYREVMVLFYLEGKSATQIAREQKTTENAVRQRLFSARQEIKNEVKTMDKIKKPILFETINFDLIGTGNPGWGDPRVTLQRQLSKQIVWICKNKARTAKEISEMLNIPMIYVEEELEILCYGENGYGVLQKSSNGRYCHNVLILDKRQKDEVIGIYMKHIEEICQIISDYVQIHKAEYLAFPFVNHKVPENLVFWLHSHILPFVLDQCVNTILTEKYLTDYPKHNRDFTIYGYLSDGSSYGCGWDGISASNVCGFKNVHFSNLYNSTLKAHFHCGQNIGADKKLQLALSSIEGLPIDTLNEEMREQAALAIREGYLYKEGNMLYTKILGYRRKDEEQLFSIDHKMAAEFHNLAEEIAKEIAGFIKREIPDYLLTEACYVNSVASLPLVDQVIEKLISINIINRPETTPGAEGCYFGIEP